MSLGDGSESFHSFDETDLLGFDGLWNVDYNQTKDFIQFKVADFDNKAKAEIDLLNKELEEKQFETQKLNWQLSEREKELKNLYDEMHRLLDLNKKLNEQLKDYEDLIEKQDLVLQLANKTSEVEPNLPKFK